ncbi:DUF6090 family protein [Mangrovibacterium diazotrophicum]|uniref:Uncharacterized protein n=1 Tax=Mangrovibacterium diazotrophicum TaxID=1261403 RepID=A0A419W9I5_9BACT|nr:DUF6090 family protein [Mangrovibacterium diazotrophicum]RKD92135.1 hypothetical protein BC643_2505 [Mangrovibacterium diazotrophicum]
MLRFFSTIRYKLAAENRVGKYLRYAVGEILLVVIGILIALQVNNWNNSNNDHKRMKIALKAISNDLVKDSLFLTRYFAVNSTEQLALNNQFRDRVLSEQANLDTLVKIAAHEFSYTWMPIPKFNTDTYESLKSTGLIEKVPDSLKVALSKLYNEENFSNKIFEDLNNQYRERLAEFQKTYPIVFGHKTHQAYITDLSWENVDPLHFNPRFFGIISTRHILYKTYTQQIQILLTHIRNTLRLLDEFNHDKST